MNNGKSLNEDNKDQTPHFDFKEVNNQLLFHKFIMIIISRILLPLMWMKTEKHHSMKSDVRGM